MPEPIIHLRRGRSVIGVWPGVGCVRICGYGLHWKDTRRFRPLWSERQRVFWQVRIGPWLVTPVGGRWSNGRGWRRGAAARSRSGSSA